MQNSESTIPVIRGPEFVVVIAAGSGGPQALAQILPRIPATFPGTIIVVQHMRNGFTRVLGEMFNQVCNLPVHEPVDGQALQQSRILMAPCGFRLSLSHADFGLPGWRIIIEDVTDSSDARLSRIDDTLTSIAQAFGKKTIGVLLTGIGTDGCNGLKAIHAASGRTIAQDSNSSVVFDLPSSAIEAGVVHEVLPLWSIAERVVELEKEVAYDTVAA